MMEGKWSELLILIRWHKSLNIVDNMDGRRRFLGPIPAWPYPEAGTWNCIGRNRLHIDAGPPQHLTAPKLELMAQSLRELAPSLNDDSAQKLSSVVIQLDTWAESSNVLAARIEPN